MSGSESSGVVSTKPPSGFRDFIGVEAERRQWLHDKISSTYRSFGFEGIETPSLENLDVLFGSGGQENEKLIFKALKRGEKLEEVLQQGSPILPQQLSDLGLRFDLTVPLCRVFSQYRGQIQLPWKVFHIAPVWRAERPQKGRYREFTQCDVDIIGSKSLAAEAEVIQAVVSAFSQVGVSDLVLHFNHRELLQGIASRVGIESKLTEFAILMDKRDKLPLVKLQAEMEALFQKNLPAEVLDLLEGQITLEKAEKYAPQAIAELQELYSLLKSLNLPLHDIVFDPSLARGMGYYTGSVFELKHASAGYAFGGGGRYDKLIGRFAKTDVPAVGFSIGFERLLLFLEEQKIEFSHLRPIFVPVFEEKLRRPVMEVAHKLRQEKFKVDVYAEDSKIKNQFRYATAKNYKWVLILGEEELKSHKFKLKDLDTGEETEVLENQLVASLRQKLKV